MCLYRQQTTEYKKLNKVNKAYIYVTKAINSKQIPKVLYAINLLQILF